MRVEVVLTPPEISRLPRRDLSDATCVVFDVLRATSTILTALFNGARRVYPVGTVEEALTLRASRLPGALLGGERGGVRIDGFDLGNSPREYTSETVAGRDIITTTTNGTVALRACAGAKTVLAGALLNLRALADDLGTDAAKPQCLMLVCAGTGERFALEDGLAAGALITLLTARQEIAALDLDDGSLAMCALFKRWRHNPLGALQASENGRRLAQLGLDGDTEWCARESSLDMVAVLRQQALEGERVPTVPSGDETK